MWLIFLAVAVVLAVIFLAFIFALLRAAARYEEEYPHLTDYRSEWKEIKEEE